MKPPTILTGSKPRRVTILSSVHLALDNRVFYREARTLARAGYDVTDAVHDRYEVRWNHHPAVAASSCWQRPILWRQLLNQAVETQADMSLSRPELLLVSPFLRRRTGRPTIYDIHEVYPEFVEIKDYFPSWSRRPLAQAVRIVEPVLPGTSGSDLCR
ncbi:MAG: hypothetical protein R3C44_20025 [Chloroflexota bacterium]